MAAWWSLSNASEHPPPKQTAHLIGGQSDQIYPNLRKSIVRSSGCNPALDLGRIATREQGTVGRHGDITRIAGDHTCESAGNCILLDDIEIREVNACAWTSAAVAAVAIGVQHRLDVSAVSDSHARITRHRGTTR